MNDLPQFRSDDRVIVVMGVTGSGKSTFIDKFVDVDVQVGHNLVSCTVHSELHLCQSIGQRLWLLDTPGFDDTRRDDVEVLRDIATVLLQLRQCVELAGIIYLHPVTDIRMRGAAQKTLKVLRAMCGEDAFKYIALVTTQWELYDPRDPVPVQRELELLNMPRWWAQMRSGGSPILRHDNTVESAHSIAGQVLAQHTEHGNLGLQLHREMIDGQLSLENTAAGREIVGELHQLRTELQLQKEQIEDEFKRAIRERDDQHAAEMSEQSKSHAQQLRQAEEAQQQLRASFEGLLKAKEADYIKLQQEMQEQREQSKRQMQDLERQLEQIDSARRQEAEAFLREKSAFEQRITVLQQQNRYLEARSKQTDLARIEDRHLVSQQSKQAQRSQLQTSHREAKRTYCERCESSRAQSTVSKVLGGLFTINIQINIGRR